MEVKYRERRVIIRVGRRESTPILRIGVSIVYSTSIANIWKMHDSLRILRIGQKSPKWTPTMYPNHTRTSSINKLRVQVSKNKCC